MDIFLSKQLKYFMVMVEEKNVSKAAEALCITRSPLTKKINDLETILDARLFQKTRNELLPTPLAIEYYRKCKTLYEELKIIDNDIVHRNSRKITTLIFDISVSMLVIKHIQAILETEFPGLYVIRKAITIEDTERLNHEKNLIIISLRELPFTLNITPSKWRSEGLSIILPKSMSDNGRRISLPIYIWKDKYSSCIKNSVKSILNKHFYEIHFIEHNMDLSNLLHLIKNGKGCALQPFKFLQSFKIDGICGIKIDNYMPYIHIYHHATTSSSLVNRIKVMMNAVT